MLEKLNCYVAKLSIFFITVALVVGMVSCGNASTRYHLTISTTAGGSTIPGEGTHTYDAGEVVNLVAEPYEGYRFVNWTGNVSTIANVNAATTAITMDDDYTITSNFAFEIRDWYDLDAIRNDRSVSYFLMNNLDSSTPGYEELASPTANGGKGWRPIEVFNRILDGQGHEIRDLFISRPNESAVGLFGAVYEGGVIKDVGVVNVTVTGNFTVGGLVGLNHKGTVSNSYSTGSVSGNDQQVGGLMGSNTGTVSNSYSTGNVTGYDSVGGLVGLLMGLFDQATVSNSYSTGSVTGYDSVGGLVGFVAGNGSIVSNSYSTGNVTGTSYVGGLVGINGEGTVSNSFWDTQTSGQTTSAGGMSKNTTEMQDIATFLGVGWNITAVANPGTRNPSYIWNIVDDQTYPFLNWQP